MLLATLLLFFVPLVSPFTTSLEMSYKPPVQSSVNKIRSSRLSSITGSEEKQRRISSKQQASAAAFVATPPPAPTSPSKNNNNNNGPSFEGRMRGLVFGRSNNKKTTIKLPSNVCTVETLEEYKTIVGEEDTKLVCVRFYAPWCKACKAVAPLFYHMANKFPNIVFVDVPVTDKNTNLHQGLGVLSLPFGHIYHPNAGLVEELRMTRKCIPSFATKLQSYVTGSCELKGVGETTSPYPPEQQQESN